MNCQSCSEEDKIELGCFAPSTIALEILDGEKHTRCPLKNIPRFVRDIVSLYNAAKIFPIDYSTYAKSFPAILLPVIPFIDDLLIEYEKLKAEYGNKGKA